MALATKFTVSVKDVVRAWGELMQRRRRASLGQQRRRFCSTEELASQASWQVTVKAASQLVGERALTVRRANFYKYWYMTMMYECV